MEGGAYWEEVIFKMVEKLMDVEEDALVVYTWMIMKMLMNEDDVDDDDDGDDDDDDGDDYVDK